MVTGIVLAGGRGSRMGSDVPKQYLLLAGKPLLSYSLQAFEESTADAVVLVTAAGEEEYCRREIVEKYGFRKVRAVTAGGRERYESVYYGLLAAGGRERQHVGSPELSTAEGRACQEPDGRKLSGADEPELVLIHDGARPLVTPGLIDDMIQKTREYGACVAGMPVKDTVQMTNAENEIVQTPKREQLWAAQTPQAFSFPLVFDAYSRLMQEKEIAVTDDASVVRQYFDVPVRMVQGGFSNLKVTTPEDLVLAEALLKHAKKEL